MQAVYAAAAKAQTNARITEIAIRAESVHTVTVRRVFIFPTAPRLARADHTAPISPKASKAAVEIYIKARDIATPKPAPRLSVSAIFFASKSEYVKVRANTKAIAASKDKIILNRA